MSSIIPLIAEPSQRLSVTLGGQRCVILIRQLSTGVYFDLAVAGTPVVNGMVCRDRVGLVRYDYRGFMGQIVFIDTQGVSDPTYDGFGTRYHLIYIP